MKAIDVEEKKPSDIIEEFLNLLNRSHEEYEVADAKIKAENERTLHQTHVLEDCDIHDIFRFGFDWQKALLARRAACDQKAMYEKIHAFAISENNKPTLKRLKGLLTEQQRTEEYLDTPYKERQFKGGVKNEPK